ncbi:MAG TPA: hypothetical protein VME18_03050 [Acidobacteriaceae bacterium]|nr:hypothetical protein [Acidobacteriaceae bacterium]
MVSNELKSETRRAWHEYGEAIVKAWRFPPGSPILTDGVEELLSHFNDKKTKAFVEWVREQTEEVRSMKFVGEDWNPLLAQQVLQQLRSPRGVDVPANALSTIRRVFTALAC